MTAKGQIGPVTFDPDKTGLDLDVHGAPKFGTGGEAKIAAKYCVQGKF